MNNKRIINERHAPKDGLDFYATPGWATDALTAFLLREGHELQDKTCWEPACGDCRMSLALGHRFRRMLASDVVHRCDLQHGTADFTSPLERRAFMERWGRPDWIITNPPFNQAMKFANDALDECENVAILARLSWLEGSGRFEELFSKRPPNAVAVFVNRIAFVKDGDDEASSGSAGVAAHAWYVWSHELREAGAERKIFWLRREQG